MDLCWQSGEETFFKVKPNTKMEKIFSAYAQRKGVPPSALRFLLDGTRISGDQTPKMVRDPNGLLSIPIHSNAELFAPDSWNWKTRTRSIVRLSRWAASKQRVCRKEKQKPVHPALQDPWLSIQ